MNRIRHVLLTLLMSLTALSILSASNVMNIETEHTTIIYETQDRESALTIASFADEVYEQLAGALNYTEMKKVPVILFSGSSMANGSFSSTPLKITMHITSAPDLFLTSRSSWLYSLFVHELTHYLHLTQRVGPASFLTPVFGPEVPLINTPLMPGWWIEGITTYMETAYAPGGRGSSSRFLMPVRENPDILPLSKTSYASVNPPKGRIYLGGNILVSYLMEAYGEDIYSEINRSFSWLPFLGMGSAVKRVTGSSLSDIYSKALERIDAPTEQEGTVDTLITQGEGMHDIITARDDVLYIQRWDLSNRLSLLSYRNGELMTIEENINGISEDAMTITENDQSLYVLFRSYNPYTNAPIKPASVSYTDLYRYDRAGSEYTPLSEGLILRQISVSQDGKHIAAAQAVKERYRLVEFDTDEGNMRIVAEEEGASLLFPVYSPDASSLAAVRNQEGTSSLVLITGDETRVLIDSVPQEIQSVRFVDSETISFTSDRDLPFSLYTYDLDSGMITRILSDPIGILDAVVRGEEIYYQKYRDGWTQIFKTERNRDQEEVVTFSPSVPQAPLFERELINREESVYHDMVKFNFWFPYPILETDAWGAGVYSLFTSVLRNHTLLLMGGYTFNDQSSRFHGEYRYTPGPFILSAQGSAYPQEKEATVGTSLLIPLYHTMSPKGQQVISTQATGRYIYSDGDQAALASASLGYAYASPSAVLDTFGRYRVNTSYSLNYFGPTDFISYGVLSAGTPSFIPHHYVQHTLRGLSAHGPLLSTIVDPEAILAPEYITVPAHDGTARFDYTLSYAIPCSTADIPFMYGGFTDAELTFSARIAAVLNESSFILEDDVILSAQMSMTYTLGIGFNLVPYVGLQWAPASGEFGVRVGIDTDTFLSTLPASDQFIDTIEAGDLR